MKLAIVGAGKMGGAVLTGALKAGVLSAEDIGIYHPHAERRAELARYYGVSELDDDGIHHAERVLISVKPQYFDDVAPLVAQRNASYISLMAGVSAATIAKRVGSSRVVRAMPNLGARLGLSATALAHLPQATQDDLTLAEKLFKAVGTVYHIPESLFDAFTGFAASGPAFAAVVAEAFADGGVRVGFNRTVAKDLARQVLLATAKLLESANPADIKDEVASAGGTAITGIKALEQHGLRYALIEAIEAASLRASELSREDD
jgi:pyrroline-5-carboxylate reductase